MKAMLLPVLMSEMKLFFPFKCNLTENQHWPTVLFQNSDHRKHQITVNYGSLMSLQGQVTNFYTVLYGTRTTERCNYRLITQSFLDFLPDIIYRLTVQHSLQLLHCSSSNPFSSLPATDPCLYLTIASFLSALVLTHLTVISSLNTRSKIYIKHI